MNFSNETLVSYMSPTFSVVDYVVFAAFLLISGVVGIYFSVKGHKNTDDYFFGGREMGPIPTGISCGVSFLSALALIGYPSEIYINGTDILVDPFVGAISYATGGMVIAVVIHPLGMTSLSEYFTKRFNSKLLIYVANILVLLCIFEYMGTTMLASVVALTSATGGQVTFVVGLTIAGAVGIFYTSIGGLEAVVWTDVIQCGFMLTGILVVMIHAIADTPGGFSTIIEENQKYKRIHPMNASFDPRVRHTLWGITIGKFMYLIMWPFQPAAVQRVCSTKRRRDACLVGLIAGFMFILFGLFPLLAGFSIFGYYANRGCDIFAAGWIKRNDIILYYTRERLNYPGFQGFFIAAICAGTLSSFSSGLSSASVILWKDTIKPLISFEVSELKATMISKVLVVIFGILSLMWSYILNTFGGMILQVTLSFDASMYGAYFSLFMFALFFRHGSYKGALGGLAVGFFVTLWLSLGSMMRGQRMGVTLPSITDNCYREGQSFNVTTLIPTSFETTLKPSDKPCVEDQSMLDMLYSISYVWLPMVCVCVSLLVGAAVTGCTGPKTTKGLDKRLVISLCRSTGKKKSQCSCLSKAEHEGDVEENIPFDTQRHPMTHLQ